MKYIILAIIYIISIHPVYAITPSIPKSFTTAKKRLYEKIEIDNMKTFYCGCGYTSNLDVDQASCGYTPRNPTLLSGKENTRDNRVEAEHIISASEMGNGLVCWSRERETFDACVRVNGTLMSGRSCCMKTNPTFKKAHNDLINLVPAIGEVNGDRVSRWHEVISGELRQYGMCDVEIDKYSIEPSDSIKGNVARIYLYMVSTYGTYLPIFLNEVQLEQMRQWNEEDPVDEAEVKRNDKICSIQGSSNPLISKCE